jgi:outer membrane protein OmpA-like peptidoglycan-associated protein
MVQVPAPRYVFFTAYSGKLSDVKGDQAIENTKVFNWIAKMLLDNPKYRLLIDGHANPVEKTAREEAGTLMPLSKARAEAVANFLTTYYGIDRSRYIYSYAGGRYPITDNVKEGHKNRIVRLALVPQ